MLKTLQYIIILSAFLFSENNDNYHISLSLHENLINDFFANMGEIKSSGKSGPLKYNWSLLNPRIDIEEDTILFISKIRLGVGDMKTHKDVQGWISAHYDQEINKVKLKIEEAKVILDIDLFGKNYTITELDIAHYFTDSFNLNGPKPMSEFVEFSLPNGEKRQINVSTSNSNLVIVKDAIQVQTSLEFNQ